MPDQPQVPNAARIQSMLNDLAQARANQNQPPQATTPPPVGGTPASRIPVNLPTVAPVAQTSRPAPQPMPAPAPVAPISISPQQRLPSQVPPTLAPRPAPVMSAPAGAVAPMRPTPPPAPRELPVTLPPRPSAPPPPPAAPVISAPTPAVIPTVPKAEKPQYTSELRTMSADIGSIQVGQAPAPVAPAPVRPSTPAAGPTIVIPPVAGGGNRSFLFMVLGVLVLGIIGISAYMLLKSNGNQVAQETPTPTAQTPTPSAGVKMLSSYFGNPKGTVTITSNDTARADFRNAILTATPAARVAAVIEARRSGIPLTPAAFFDALLGNVPADVTAALGTDLTAFAFGQSEVFDSTGQAVTNPPLQNRLVLVAEVADATKMNQAMQAWEGTSFTGSAESVFGYDHTKAIITGFSSGTYRAIPVRYLNFPYADNSLDWALMLASNGKNYLIISGSREGAFFAIDQLMQ